MSYSTGFLIAWVYVSGQFMTSKEGSFIHNYRQSGTLGKQHMTSPKMLVFFFFFFWFFFYIHRTLSHNKSTRMGNIFFMLAAFGDAIWSTSNTLRIDYLSWCLSTSVDISASWIKHKIFTASFIFILLNPETGCMLIKGVCYSWADKVTYIFPVCYWTR